MQILWRTACQRKKIIAQPSVRHAPFLKEKNHAQSSVDTKKKVEKLKDTQVDRRGAEILTLNTPSKTIEKVKINEKYFLMQVDTGSDITLISVNFWQDLGMPKLKS